MFRLDVEQGIARLTLDRPESRNAISLAGWDELSQRLEEVEASGARVLLVSGAGGAFCAGADLKDFAGLRHDEAARSRFRLAMRRTLDGLRALPVPAVALIEGPCYGAGVALAMACDLRVADGDSRFAITPAKMGISYPQEDVARLVHLVGAGQAARLLFTGLPIDAREAARIGLIEMVADAETAGALITAMLDNSAESLAVLKRGIRLAERGIDGNEGQDAAFDRLFGSEDLAARLESRKS